MATITSASVDMVILDQLTNNKKICKLGVELSITDSFHLDVKRVLIPRRLGHESVVEEILEQIRVVQDRICRGRRSLQDKVGQVEVRSFWQRLGEQIWCRRWIFHNTGDHCGSTRGEGCDKKDLNDGKGKKPGLGLQLGLWCCRLTRELGNV